MPSEAHVNCYTHPQGSLTISAKKLPDFFLPGEPEGKIWMWHRCLKCPRTNGFPPATRRVIMSDAAWGLSFGKFLELSFSNNAAASRVAGCGHFLHRDCLRFYGYEYIFFFLHITLLLQQWSLIATAWSVLSLTGNQLVYYLIFNFLNVAYVYNSISKWQWHKVHNFQRWRLLDVWSKLVSCYCIMIINPELGRFYVLFCFNYYFLFETRNFYL